MNAKRKLLEKLMRNGDIDGADKLASEICRACGADMSRGVSLSDVRKNLNATKRRMRRRTFAAAVLFMLVAAALTVGAVFFYGGDGVGDGGSEAMTASGDLPDDEGISLDVMRFYIKKVRLCCHEQRACVCRRRDIRYRHFGDFRSCGNDTVRQHR